MKKIIGLAAVSLTLIAPSIFAADYTTYTTSHGSILELSASGDDNSVTGFFTINRVTQFCPESVGVRKSITGSSVDNLVSFTASYPECHADLTFNGKLIDQHILKITSVRAHKTEIASDKQAQDSLTNV
jgi:hypothetical protein